MDMKFSEASCLYRKQYKKSFVRCTSRCFHAFSTVDVELQTGIPLN
jgi:hypothetical protein